MAHSLSAKKRVRQNTMRRALNKWRRRGYRDAIRELNETILHGTVADAEKQLQAVYKVLDQAAAANTLHKNTASRYKSRLTTRINAKKAAASAAPAA